MPSKPTARNSKATKEDDELQQPSSSRKRAGRTRISAACEACKRRKTKCTGEPLPCNSCQLLGTECVIDLALDMRRREAMQQTMHDLKSYQDLLNGLINCIRDGNAEAMQSLQDVFRRDDVAMDEISAVVQRWAQTIRDRSMGFEEDRALTTSETPSTPQSKSSARAQVDIQSDDLVLDPLLRSEAATEPNLNSFDFLAAMARRIRDCSEAESVDILASLLQTNFQSEMKTGAFERNQEASSRRQQGVSRESFKVTPSASTSTSTLQSPNLSLRSTIGSMPQGKSGILPDFQQDGSWPEAQSSLSNVANPIASDLVVAKDSSGTLMRIPIHLVQPSHLPDDTSLSRVYTDYLNGARQMLANNVPVSDIIGSNNDVIVDLLYRNRQEGDKWDCSSWASEFCRGFTEYDINVRLAGVYVLTRLMQWLLVPSAESYARLPVIMRPSALQCMIPHIAAIDLILIPALRDAIIANPRDWVSSLAAARITVNWPQPEHEAMELVPNTGSHRLTQRFIDHLSKYDNWSVDAQILDSFPELAGRIRIHG